MRFISSIIASFRNQHGAALPMVLILMVFMVVFSMAAYQMSQGNTGSIVMASSSEKALYAAEQGYNRTLWRLNNEKSSFLAAEDPTPDPIKYPENSDICYNRYELTVPNSSNYRVHVLVPLVEIEGQTDKVEDNYRRIIRSTGWDSRYPERLRSIEVEVYKKTFTQYVMANNSEKTGNTKFYWLSEEKVYGPLHTNDTLYVDGTPVFYGPVTYVKGIDITPSSNMYNPAIFKKGNSQVAETLSFSSSLSELKAHAKIDGHYYNGRTCIHLENGGYNVRYYDRSTNTWHYNDAEYRFLPTNGKVMHWWDIPQSDLWWDWEIANEEADKSNHAMFQKIFRDANGTEISTQNFPSFEDFKKTVDRPLPLPPNGVIYVDGETGGNDTDGVSKYNVNRGNVFVSGKLDGRLTIAAANDIFITAHDPCDWRRPPWDSSFNWSSWWENPAGVTYKDTGFEQVFENGEWTHTKVTQKGEDMLGLVATNNVNVMHFNWLSQHDGDIRFRGSIGDWFQYSDYCWSFMNAGGPVDHAPNNIYIHAAIYAQNESFGFETAYEDPKRDAKLVGSIAQNNRGPMGKSGWFGGGYKKNYTHDPRLLYDAPPHFPNPANSGWQSSHWNEIKDHIN